MKFRKNHEPVKKEKTTEAADEVLQELDTDAVQQISGGAGNPFANVPRMENQAIDDDLRNNG